MTVFSKVGIAKPRYSKFDLSHEKKISFNMGELVPFYLQEIVPGDKFQVNSEIFLRFAPMVAPIMHRINVYTHFFFVPNRLLMEEKEWNDFITGGQDGLDSTTWPYTKITDGDKAYWYKGRLPDYLGLPVTDSGMTVSNELKHSVLPYRAYQLIYNEYYRDQNLVTEVAIDKSAGIITASAEKNRLTTLRSRAWQRDYFTSCLPWLQKGAAVELDADVTYKTQSEFYNTAGGSPTGDADVTTKSDHLLYHDAGSGDVASRVENVDAIQIDINELRYAVRLQEWLEKNARAGSRYVESILAHFGVRSSDQRLQRPEFLGGGSQPVSVSEVLQTSEAGTTPQGEMTGHGISVGKSNTFKRMFEEHGFVIGIISVMPKTAYQQGVNKLWLRDDKLDYYWPEFANLSEQEVLLGELYYDPEGTQDDHLATFGYQSRYAEYKTQFDQVAGDFRDDFQFWHLGRYFSGTPALNQTFIECNPSHRIFAVTDTDVDKLWCQIYNKVDALRPMPYLGIPTL